MNLPSFARLAVCLISTFAECIISEAGDTACRMAHLRAAVAHVVSGCGNIALRVGNTDKTQYAVILKRGGNLTVRTALLVVFKVLPLPLVWVAWTWKIFQRSKKDHIL